MTAGVADRSGPHLLVPIAGEPATGDVPPILFELGDGSGPGCWTPPTRPRFLGPSLNTRHRLTPTISRLVHEVLLAQAKPSIERDSVAEVRQGPGKVWPGRASEVRKLAERSRSAAAEIAKLVESSTVVAERSGQLIAALVPSIRKTADLVGEVSTTTQAQADGVQQVSRAMSVVDQVTQRNAAAAEELSSTAAVMASQAEALQNLVAFFRIGA